MAYTPNGEFNSLQLRDSINAAKSPEKFAERVLYSGDDGPSDEDICSGKTGYHWDSTTGTCVKDGENGEVTPPNGDDKTKKPGSEHKTEDACRAAGGIWDSATSTCEMFQKPEPHEYKQAQPKVGQPGSETERLASKQKLGSPIAESVRSTMTGEVKGLGEKWRQLKDMDAERLMNEDLTRQAQDFAAKGMSFSTPMLAAQKDSLREYSKQRQISKDEADAMQMKLNIQALKNSEPIEQLAVSGRLGALEDGSFVPGKIPDNLYMDPQFGLKDPKGFSGLPTDWPGKEMGEDVGPQDDDPYTDDTGIKCTVGELDDFKRCPDNPNYETGAEGADPEEPDRPSRPSEGGGGLS